MNYQVYYLTTSNYHLLFKNPLPLVNLIKGMFEIAFEEAKSAFYTQKIYLKKKYLFDKKIKSAFKGPKSLKWQKMYFWQ